MVRGIGKMYITGPDVIRAVTGEEVTHEELGGADTHGALSGVAHFSADDEDTVFESVRWLLEYLPSNNLEESPRRPTHDDPERRDPGLDSVVPESPMKPYDMHDVLHSVLDDGEFLEVQPSYATNIIVGFGRLDGRSIGAVANQPREMAGTLDINSSTKAARFVRFCDAFNIPLLTFVDVPGFLPGTSQEYNGIIRHGAKLLYAYAEATVPKITVITRKAYGGAYDVMCSKHLGADFNYAWPSAEIAVMGPSAAVSIIFRKELAAAEDPGARAAELTADYLERFANPYYAAERGYLDAVIEPRETRPTLIRAFALAATKREARPSRKHGNIPL
jgi:acetyl-CoA carboxylase carboxyltransferase component